MEELQNASAGKKILGVVIIMALGMTFFGFAALLANVFSSWLDIQPKAAMALGIVTAIPILFVVAVLLDATVTRMNIAISDRERKP